MRSWLARAMLFAAAVGLGCAAGWSWPHSRRASFAPTIQQVQALSSLVTTRVVVADVRQTAIRGRLGGVRAAILLRGDVLLEVDLSRARLLSIDSAQRTAVLRLPQPRVRSPRLDHRRTRLWSVSSEGLWRLVPTEASAVPLLNQAFAEGQRAVAEAARNPALAKQARAQAEQVLGTFFGAMGWKLVIRWEE